MRSIKQSSLNIKHIRVLLNLFLVRYEVRKRRRVQNLRNAVADSKPKVAFGRIVFFRKINRRNRAFQNPDYIARRNRRRLLRQDISAVRAANALNKAGISEWSDQLLQIMLRQLV